MYRKAIRFDSGFTLPDLLNVLTIGGFVGLVSSSRSRKQRLAVQRISGGLGRR